MAEEACYRACMMLGHDCMQVQDARQMLQVLVMGMKTLLYSMATYGNTVLSRSNMPPRYAKFPLDGGEVVYIGQMLFTSSQRGQHGPAGGRGAPGGARHPGRHSLP